VFWAGGLIGAIFGLAGIFVAACLYLFYALIKLVFLLAAFTAQLIFAISGLIAKIIIQLLSLISRRMAATDPVPRASTKRSRLLKAKATPAGLRPKRNGAQIRPSRKA
jgi:hypothetical protein